MDGDDGVYRASSSANVVLYVGLGMAAIGLVITFVGLGDKGFRTLELKLIGPSLVGCGVFFALLRVLFCTVPSCCRACVKCCRGQGKGSENKSLLQDKKVRGHIEKVSLAEILWTTSAHFAPHFNFHFYISPAAKDNKPPNSANI